MIQSVFSVTLTMHFECRFRVWCLWQCNVCVIYWHLCPILTSAQTWWLCLYHEWTINPWMVRWDKGRWAVVSPTRRFSNVPFANVLSRFAYETKRELHIHIPRSFNHDTKNGRHTCVTVYRVSQKFVPLISCTITFDQNFYFYMKFLEDLYFSIEYIYSEFL